jgi:predicted exporter
VFGLHRLVPAITRDGAPPPALQSFWQRADPDAAIAALRESAAAAGLAPAAVSDAETLIRQVLTPSPAPTLDQLRAAGAPLDRFIAADASPPLTVVLYRTAEALTDRTAQRRTIGALRRALEPHPEARITGYTALGLDAEGAIRRDLARLTGVAAIGISLCLLLFLRSWWRPLLVFLPVAYALLILLGVMHIAALLGGGGLGAAGGLRLDMISIAALPLLIGIAVDDGVFLVWQHTGAQPRRHSTRATIHAVTTTSATTALAFASLATSAMPALRTLGLAAAVGVAAAWVGAVFLLYPLLHRATSTDSHA